MMRILARMPSHCSLLLLLIFPFFFLSTSSTLAANNNLSFLNLSRGLNLSILSSYNSTSDGYPISTDLRFTVVMPTLDQGFFFPILSSPSFNSSNSSHSRGFSLGFYILPNNLNSDFPLCDEGCNAYLAVCAGLSGNTSSVDTTFINAGATIDGGNTYINPYLASDGFVVPVWIMNLDKPIRDWSRASLGVVAAADSKNNTTLPELQLREADEIVWNVSNVGMMEMQDSGDLLIFYSAWPITTNPVWQSSTDTLVDGQKLRVGGELRSNDSVYLARMEKGGLVLYFNNAHFGNNMGLMQPRIPYWIFPIFNPSHALVGASIDQLISSAPCSNSPAFAVLDDDLYNFHLDPGSCNLFNTSFMIPAGRFSPSWGFLRLEKDGRLYSYTVTTSTPSGGAPSITRLALDSDPNGSWLNVGDGTSLSESVPFFSQWGPYCGVPMACGPIGVCTPSAKPICTCPDQNYFEAINSTDYTQGCKRQASLPECSAISGNNEHINSMDFLQLNSSASIFLFNGWNFNPTKAPVDDCKSLCSSNCSCHGFFYQVTISACFFITDEFTLLTVSDKNLLLFNITFNVSDLSNDPIYTQEIIAESYVTHLKVVSLTSGFDNCKSNNKSTTTVMIIILPTFVVCFVIGIMACLGYRLVRARKRKLVQIRLQAEEDKELEDILPLLPCRFSYKDLHKATKGFSKLLGAGGCGSVYAGILLDGRKVAVKVLQVVLQGSDQSRQFLAEVRTVGRTSHHNIVRLYGFCWELSHRLLVYEYVERGSLDRWLFVDELDSFLDWQTRYNVALGINRGLHYLHEECEQPILHFDIKPQNILLGDDFVAKLADFGMSRLIRRDASSVVTGVRGTPGYIAPEWFSHGTVSKRSDIFSMGMLLLELVGGRKILDYSFLNSSLDSTEQEAWHFPSWAAKKCEQGLMMELLDKRLHVCGFDGKQVQRLIHIAFWCIHEDPSMRPNALTVVQWLEGIQPKRYPPFSTIVNSSLSKPSLATYSMYDKSHIDHISMI